MESLHVRQEGGVDMIIAIDSTARGPALGGCRWRPYDDPLEARRDAVALARAMTRKAALARLALGGGKAVVSGNPRLRTADQIRIFGELVDSLGGRYITAADMGTGEETMAAISSTTRWVAGLPRRLGGPGDPAPFTARGVYLAIERALEHRDRPVDGASVAVQGAGSVGAALAHQLVEAGARVSVADPDPARLSALPEAAEVAAIDDIAQLDCDVFAPCGPGGLLDVEAAAKLRCSIVCGAANNPLADPEVAARLDERGILYVPDFVANAGGLIHLAVAVEGGDRAITEDYLRVIPENLDSVLAQAKAELCSTDEAAARLADSLIP